jgi:hypothetical protein
MMTHRHGVACVAFATVLAGATPAAAQGFMLPWFNGFGVWAGGGALRFDGEDEDPLVTLIRPDEDSQGAAAFGLELTLGTRRWALMLPEFHYVPVSLDVQSVGGTLTLGSRTVTFEPEAQDVGMFALLAGAQAAVVPSGRVWVRGGIGGGWIARHIAARDQNIAIDLSTSDRTGLALAAAAGASVWEKQLAAGRRTSIDVGVHYIRVRTGEVRVSTPSVRVGWRYVFLQ